MGRDGDGGAGSYGASDALGYMTDTQSAEASEGDMHSGSERRGEEIQSSIDCSDG